MGRYYKFVANGKSGGNADHRGHLCGKFFPLNKEKYTGSVIPTYRSSWEFSLMQWADRNSNILQWSSESLIVPYKDPTRIDPNSGKPTIHKYIVDFNVVVKQKDGSIRKFLVEVKPASQTKAPKKTKRTTEASYQEKLRTYVKNCAKWKAATIVAKQRGWSFILITEKELGIK